MGEEISYTGWSPTSDSSSIETDEKLLANRFDQIVEGLPSRVQVAVRNGNLCLKLHPSSLPNAECSFHKGQCVNVTFNSGLIRFLYRTLRAFSTQIRVPDVEVLPSVDMTRQILTDIVFWMWFSQVSFGPTHYQISRDQIVFANQVTCWAENFFLAHEMSHVEDFLSGKISDSDSDELHADQFAADVISKVSGNSVKLFDVDLSLSGAILGLSVFHALEELGFPFEKTHPPASLRKQKLLELASEDKLYDGRAVEVAHGMEEKFHILFSPLGQDSWQDRLRRMCGNAISELYVLLERCATIPFPDYHTFSKEGIPLLNAISAPSVYDIFRTLVPEGIVLAEKGSNVPAATEDDMKRKWGPMLKMKLLLRATWDIEEPRKQLLKEVFGL